ncbi:MAG: type II toxin-antitoxin system VapC family toxin [Proteobacteria bacterium]|nr:type II toxin-antitoxin system VapC family toxin [Pseudomonadota bacterium]
MRLLLDTHVLVWSQEDPDRLSAASRELLLDPTRERFVHTISTLELARLADSGRLSFRLELAAWLRAALGALGAQTLELSHEDAFGAYQLPGAFHKDPADRILVSATRHRGLTLMTADERILAYPHVASLAA